MSHIVDLNGKARASGLMLIGIAISLRPYQWIKNVLVFAALFFSLSFLNLEAVILSLKAFAGFCLVSSGVYLMNDIRDLEADRLHPEKRNRPIAAGRVPVNVALAALAAFLASGLALGYSVNTGLLAVLLSYFLINVGYSFGLKRVVLLDVMIVAFGFLLRAVGGAVAIRVDVSPWLFICTLLLALLLVFGKRRHELASLKAGARRHRKSLANYTLPFIDGLMFVSAGAALVTYSLYTMADETAARFGTQWLALTTPMVIYGIFRYLYLIYIKQSGGDPTWMMLKDKPFVVNGLLWFLAVLAILFFSRTTA
ncbi:MAG: decaprenyl-phosphate phosphoribosyltransferase [Phaeodactylibacter sp.]|nr:decaprenyl-phosphate phosphoribosyltransferase [Phaeodactylibacter sp.]